MKVYTQFSENTAWNHVEQMLNARWCACLLRVDEEREAIYLGPSSLKYGLAN